MNQITESSPIAAFRQRFAYFFGFNSIGKFYKICKILSIIIFTIPFSVLSILEFIILTPIKILLWLSNNIFSFKALAFLRVLFGLVLGMVYFSLSIVFVVAFWACDVPDFVLIANRSLKEPLVEENNDNREDSAPAADNIADESDTASNIT